MDRALKIAGFYPIVDGSQRPDVPAYRMAEWILSSGVPVLQLRQKELDEKQFLELAMEISYLRIHNAFRLIINHHVSVAKAMGADGVHLTGNSVSAKEARAILGPQALIGVSVHSVDEAEKSEKEGADYVTFGAIYSPGSKGSDYPVQGIEKLQEVVARVSIPVIAVGGIDTNQISEIKKAGAAGFSVITAVSRHANPAAKSKELCGAWEI